ncbi:MAG: ribbon-helix-helix protein, CopG family [Erysipelotrichia bacterium]|nr:ribbon-helix-helix protein, CopG family [Erysipelotrichia bacterium]
MSKKTKAHLITMSDDHWEKLKLLAKSKGLSSSAMIRVLINNEIDKNENKELK